MPDRTELATVNIPKRRNQMQYNKTGALKMRDWNLRHKRGQKCRAGKCEKNKLGAYVCG